jgi:diadenosine tetraphosphate (Ap4A) HIT family hydrolase
VSDACAICTGEADRIYSRTEIWSNDLWRLTMHRGRALGGFCYLEPRRHIAYVTDLEGEEAATFGSVLAWSSRTLKAATGAELIYVYVFGGHIPHLHVHLAPHKAGDAYCGEILHGDLDEALMEEPEVERFRAAFAGGEYGRNPSGSVAR